MAFQVVPQAVMATIEGRVDNQLTINDLGFVSSGAVTAVSMQALATNLGNWVGTSLAPLLSEDWASVRVRVVDLTSPTGFVVEQPAPYTGGVASEAAPNNVAACISFRTAQRGRSGRGRNYIPGIPNVDITLNTLSTTLMDDLITAYSLLEGAGSFEAGWQWVVISRFSAGFARAEGLTIPVTNVLFTANTVRSMRSREVGHGA